VEREKRTVATRKGGEPNTEAGQEGKNGENRRGKEFLHNFGPGGLINSSEERTSLKGGGEMGSRAKTFNKMLE